MDARDSCEDYNCRAKSSFFLLLFIEMNICVSARIRRSARVHRYSGKLFANRILSGSLFSLRSPSLAWSFNFHSLYIHRCGYYFSCFLFNVAHTGSSEWTVCLHRTVRPNVSKFDVKVVWYNEKHFVVFGGVFDFSPMSKKEKSRKSPNFGRKKVFFPEHWSSSSLDLLVYCGLSQKTHIIGFAQSIPGVSVVTKC